MNQSFNIFRFKILSQGLLVLRRLLLVVLMITAALCVNAQLPNRINGVYYITSADDFKALMSNQAYWAAGNTFIQLADIVFDDDDVLTPIGNPTVPFRGVYDGRGHSLINGKMYWDSANPIYGYGIFGYLHNTSAKPATIKNLKIDNFTLTRATDNSLVYGNNDIKLGVLAAIIGEHTQISNICITNSRITDGGRNTRVKALMAGGVVGDFFKSASQTTAEINSTTFVFRNIFADVDIDLQHTVKNSYDDPQMFVGGILGRIRSSTNLRYIPDNTIYTGTILAPSCSESPTVSNMRYSLANDYANLVGTYSGEYNSNTLISSLSDADYNDFVKSRMFYDYKAYNSNKKVSEKVTADYPSLAQNGPFAYKTRTFMSNANANGTPKKPSVSATNNTQWAMVQGVNFGRYTDPEDASSSDRQEMLELLNNAVTETKENEDHTTSPLYEWSWNGTDQKFNLVSNADLIKGIHVFIEADPNSNNYTAKINYSEIDIEHYLSGQGTIKWYTNSSATGEWTELIGEDSFTIQANKSLFYRFTWTYGDISITSDYKAPLRTIYVFNHDSNDLFNNTFSNNFHEGDTKFNYPPSERYAQAGDDQNDGSTPEKAVRTMKRAYELLDAFGEVKTNRIVVMGYYLDDDYLAVDEVVGDYSKPATITGTDNATISNGKISFSRLYWKNGVYVSKDLYWFFQAPIRLDNIEVFRHWTIDAKGNPSQVSDYGTYIICNYYDFTIDENVYFTNFPPIKTGNGLPGDITSLPFITIVGGTQDCAKNAYTDPIRYASDRYGERPGYYTEPGLTTINIRSGVIGRMICCSRNRQGNGTNITGSHLIPNRIRLNINIKDDIDLKNGVESTKYGYSLEKGPDGKLKYVLAGYSHNLGLISGGQTDGSAYADVIMNIYAGHISRIITSNITYGRSVGDAYPCDGFYGRTILNIYGNYDIDENDVVTSETTLNEVFGGMLGRMTTAATVCKPYFYGKSVINLYGGYLGKYTGSRTDLDALKDTSPNLYGVGSGGVSGLGTELQHTTDINIPYLKADGVSVQYGAFDPEKKMPVMIMYDGEEIDLAHTQCEVNLYSGFISGSVYGGGYGFSDNIIRYPVNDKGEITKDSDGNIKYYYNKAPSDIGALYGDSKVTMYRHPDFQPTIVLGNVYGGGAGSSTFAEWYEEDFPTLPNKFLKVAAQYGNTEVVIEAGGIGDIKSASGGDVYAGSQGIKGEEYDNIAAIYGSTNLTVNGGTIYGNIFGGSELANINKHYKDDNGDYIVDDDGNPIEIEGAGNTNVTINGGIIGNNIFGGSKGIDGSKMNPVEEDAKVIIEGSTNVTVNGGDFIDIPYINPSQVVNYDAQGNPNINILDNRELYRTFNIYGGGYMNCDIEGDANLNIYSSLMTHVSSFLDPRENPNAMDDPTIDDESVFHKHYMDITYRNFCVYGGGFGEKTNVLNTHVYVTIPHDRPNVSLPHGYTLQRFLDHQSFFDIAGGGYSGDVGYWATGDPTKLDAKAQAYRDEDGNPITEGMRVKNIDIPRFRQYLKDNSLSENEIQSQVVKLFDHYVGGACNVTIDDYTFARKIIGGGFYGSCNTTNTNVRCGSLRQIYGGSLLGYVYTRALLQFGNRIEDFARWNPDMDNPKGGKGAYVYSETGEYEPFKGDFENLKNNYPDVFEKASAYAKELNDNIFITENIYGGNDVKGIIGTKFWEDPNSTPANPIYGVDETDQGPLFCTDVDPSEEKGIVFNIYGGTFMGDVYSAGNGHYRGYFVPEWVRYDDGPARMYRSVISSVHTDDDGNPVLGKAYRSRPMVGCVNVNLRGNSENDFIKLRRNFFGGGRECTIGQFNTILPLEDPRRLVAGGQLHVNMGGYIKIDGNVYLGAEGKLYSQQQCFPEAIDPKAFDGSTTKELARLGDAAYDHWYYDLDQECYLPGYPAPGKVDGNFGMYGEHMLDSYMQNVQLQGDLELTFYRYLYERDDKDCYTYRTFSDGSKNRIRRHWIPGEIALEQYDAPSIVMNSFFLGGLSGSMTNNKVMKYTYPETDEYPGEEEWGCIYRVVLPEGVTVRDKVVMGSENATIKVYEYTDDFTGVKTEDSEGNPLKPVYTYEGGLITQPTFSFDLIAYNDKYGKEDHAVPDDFYTSQAQYGNIASLAEYTLNDGITKLYRYNYQTQTIPGTSTVIPYLNDRVKDDPRYSLTRKDLWDEVDSIFVEDPTESGQYVKTAHLGPREFRTPSEKQDVEHNALAVVSKLTLACKFDQLVDPSAPDPEDHQYHYGGNVYGGCYQSGIVIGDVVMNLGSNLLGNHMDQVMYETATDLSSLKYNIGRVFGGGYGKETRIEGNTYVNLLRNFKGMNVFGGGMMGDVNGRTHIKYIGTEDESYIFGGIYGGGLMGSVGIRGEGHKNATSVRLFSGNVEKVFGGSCMGQLWGRAYVELCDQVTSELEYLDYKRLHYQDWGKSRLIAGKVFGGNDIAGHISLASWKDDPTNDPGSSSGNEPGSSSGNEPGSSSGNEPGSSSGNEPGSSSGNEPGSGSTPPSPEDEIEKMFEGFSTSIYMHEEPDKRKDSPGTVEGEDQKRYNGFPLVGDLYGGSNGDYGVHGTNGVYQKGDIVLATGIGIERDTIKLGEPNQDGLPYFIPHIDQSHVLIRGGTVINAYGGGDMADILVTDKITIDYPTDTVIAKARAGFDTQQELNRVWSVLHFSSDQQQTEATDTDKNGCPIFTYQICRLFGGNNNADMAIQPTWDLKSGNIGSLYSGGNFGKMTFYQPYREAKAAVEADPTAHPPIEAQEAVEGQPELGLTLTIDSYNLTIENVYGGGRLGDIDPAIPAGVTHGTSFYGATLNIKRGIINHVYGGNDVSGYVNHGTNVNLYGAISGDVYCAGNGNYLYKYDRHGTMYNYDKYFNSDGTVLDTSTLKVKEDFAFRTEEYTGARYFMLPAKRDYGLRKGQPYEASDAEVIMAINSYRPHVGRSKLFIQGSADNKVWVRGNVYCGGNSASVVNQSKVVTCGCDSAAVASNSTESSYDVIFDIGDHVILNGVFLGSNGSSLASGDMIMDTERLNGKREGVALNMVGDNDLTKGRLGNEDDHIVVDYKGTLYPKILDLYMRAVETRELPKDFSFDNINTQGTSFIGEFCVGGNRGSMMTDKCISLTFPSTITIFGRIIGGCKDADVTYNGVTHIGGLNQPLAQGQTAKVDLKIKSKFRPLNLLFPDLDSNPPISIRNIIFGEDGKPWSAGKKYYADQQCNVYGGCFTSGTTVGDINISLYSDMLNYECYDGRLAGYIDKQAVINGMIQTKPIRSFTVVGAGYGAKTAVMGNVNVSMLPENIGTEAEPNITHPSAATIFGGSQEGLVVGNTKVEIRDGKVLANVYGASEAAKMYGSTSVIIGYPKYYRTLASGNYLLDRVDFLSATAQQDLLDEFDEIAVPKTVAYLRGDLVPQNVHDIILGRVKNGRVKEVVGTTGFRQGKSVLPKYVDHVTTVLTDKDATPDQDVLTRTPGDEEDILTFYIGDLFEEVKSKKINPETGQLYDHIVPQDYGVKWKDINIWIGDQNSNFHPDSTYYGQGNVYGGGYVPNTSDRTLVGQPTVMRFTPKYNIGYMEGFDGETKQTKDGVISTFGGNTAVMIWDDARSGELKADGEYKYALDKDDYPDGPLEDHVHIGAGYFKEVTLQPGSSVKGYFERYDKEVDLGSGNTTTESAYIYLTYGKAVDTDDNGNPKKYYEKVADGGVYGGGRKVFAQAFRAIDLAYYGYAGHTPQQPKLLNTIQRADMATVRDCCLELVGASDFTVNDYKGIYYAINRVGELRMETSLQPTKDLDEGFTNDQDGIRIHAHRRTRNYIALYNKTNHLGAYRSNWSFDQIYHLEDGNATTLAETDPNYGNYQQGKESYMNHKHRFIDFYKGYAALRKKADADPPEDFTKAEVDAVVATYKTFSGDTGYTYTQPQDKVEFDVTDYLNDIGQKVEDYFARRNVGTAGNMIGISSGYELSFEGRSRKLKADLTPEDEESIYYGPAFGVTEMKLLTTVSSMGGGYVYALNHHYDATMDNKIAQGWCSQWGTSTPVGVQDFLQTTGNFVFPGAAYNTTNQGTKRNFIIDDCWDLFDIHHGFYQCDRVHEPDQIRSRSVPGVDPDANYSHEVHYWYVSGNTYVFNVNLTAITSDSHREFFLSNQNDRVNLFNVMPGTEIKVTDVNWFVHNDLPADSCDINNLDKKYKIYLTLSSDPQNVLVEDSADKGGAYVIRLPRHSYEMGYDPETRKYVNSIYEGNKNDNFGDVPQVDGHRYIDPNYYLNAATNNNRFGYDKDGNKMTVSSIQPRLGLRLVDHEFNRYAEMGKEWSTRYYQNHLEPDHMIQVRLETSSPTKDSTEENPKYSDPIYFVINIDLKYLMGPAVYGNIKIENCALPGEYIYVNADSIEVVMDENLGVAQQTWRLYPNDDQGNRYIKKTTELESGTRCYLIDDPDILTDSKGDYYYSMTTSEFADGEYKETATAGVYKFEADNERLVHIPAYYYQNHWEPVFCVQANGENFECTLPFYRKKKVTTPDPENEGQNKTEWVEDRENPALENRLQIHNYHRMKPLYNGQVIDLRLVAGARTYLESKDDMTYFFQYTDFMQPASVPSTPTAPTSYKRFTIKEFDDPTGSAVSELTINPQHCEGLDFYQQTSLPVPTTSEFTPTNTNQEKTLVFKGSYHGNGNWMMIPSGAYINMSNRGYLYNTGFVSEVANDNTIIYNDNANGTIVNSFYFNRKEKGALAKNGTLRNCYQNTPLAPGSEDFKYNELLTLSTNGFRYGQAAYNLNGFYLQKRHMLLHHQYRKDGVTAQPKPDNNPFALQSRDVEIRKDQVIDYADFSVDYIEKMFNDGDYRYAFYKQAIDHSEYIYTQFTEALRTADEPNYFDRKSNRGTSQQVSMHNYAHTVDSVRWCDNHKLYHPIFDKDYMFFGENLTEDANHTDFLPEAYHPENRVYRVGGYYGSKVDKGYFMNRKAYLDTPKITAIDFVGYQDRQMYDEDGFLKGTDKSKDYDYDYLADLIDNGWVIRQGYQEVFMAPTLDLPWVENQVTQTDPNDPSVTTTTMEYRHDFSNFDINSDKVTHNLLIYTEDLPEAMEVMDKFHYSPNLTYGQSDEYSFATHSEDGIRAHHIVDKTPAGSTDYLVPEVYGDYFHLVDKHDFNAPFKFKAKQAWYNRQPQAYSDEYIQTNGLGEEEVYKDAWEGICLPFDVGKVYAASTDKTNMRDMGQITHFFGEDDWKGHEYWLRRLVPSSTSPVPGELNFERPRQSNLGTDSKGAPNREVTGDYKYDNTAIYDLYKDFQYDYSGVEPTVDSNNDTIWYTHDKLYHFDKNASPKSRTIQGYRYLSRSMPYIITFPGEYFYEFDLSGKFYAQKMLKYKNQLMTPVAQTICYLAKHEGDTEEVEVPVTDDVPLISYTQGDYTMKGTFVHVTDNAVLAKQTLYDKVGDDEHLAVLDAVRISIVGGEPVPAEEVHHGSEFISHENNNDMEVLPFRTYIVSSNPIPSSVVIGSRGIIPQQEVLSEEEPELPETVDAEKEGIKVWVEGQKLVIKTPYDLTTTIFDMSGRPVRHIKAYEGINRYSGLDTGFYIVLRTKFAIL